MKIHPRATVIFILGCTAMAVIVGALLVLGAVRSTQVDNTQKANERDSTLLLMQDCVTPGGKCYQRSQRQTAKAVGDISKANAVAAAAASTCAVKLVDASFSEVYKCTVRNVDRAQKKQGR